MVSIIATASGDLACDAAAGRVVWRVGYVPEPWAWTPWQYATDGRFTGRWDDPDGVWRTLYVGGHPTGLLPGGPRRVSCRPRVGSSTSRHRRRPRRHRCFPHHSHRRPHHALA